MTSLAELLTPLSQDEFFAEYFTRRHLCLSSAERDRFARIFSLADFNDDLNRHGRPHPYGIRLAKLDATHHADPGRAAHADTLAAAYRAGHTINLNDVAERHLRVRELVHRLTETFSAGVSAAAYLSPPNERAFPLHFDTHEVLILQIAGGKHWRLFPPTVELPLTSVSTRIVDPSEVGPPSFDGVLAPGDLLYVPRGTVHEATTEAEPSLHLTIGVHLPTRYDLLVELLAAEAEREPELRRALPRGSLISGDADFDEMRRLLLQALAQPRGRVGLERILVRIFAAQLPVAGDRFFETPVAAGSVLVRRPGIWAHVIADGARATLLFQGGRVDVPFPFRAALELAAETNRLAVADLPVASAEGRRVLAQRLVDAGAFTVDETGSS